MLINLTPGVSFTNPLVQSAYALANGTWHKRSHTITCVKERCLLFAKVLLRGKKGCVIMYFCSNKILAQNHNL